MELFTPEPSANLLPCDGAVFHHGPVMAPGEARRCLETLLETVPWKNDETVIFGRRVVTARRVAWYGDREYAYTYSGTVKRALVWTPELLRLKALAEEQSGESFNSCLLNLYHGGEEGMGWHSDDEKMIVKHSAIASLSFGAGRRFCFKHKRDPGLKAEVLLENGSLLVMKGATQANWLHCVPKMKRVKEPRVNLTFRTVTGE